jgi:thiol-disulfide isomerase/thioredoxin
MMMRAISVLASVAFLFGALGCDDNRDPVGEDAGDVMLPDSGEPQDTCGDPGEGYGTSEGSNFSPFTLQLCDGSDFEFYGEDEGFCDASYTVVSIAAGWCGPCRAEAMLMPQLIEDYAADNVRVVVAIIQDNDYAAPDLAFCQGWVDQYGLTNPVMIDPTQETQIYFPGNSLPATLIVDSEGVIVHREYGVSDNLETVRATLDELLGR